VETATFVLALAAFLTVAGHAGFRAWAAYRRKTAAERLTALAGSFADGLSAGLGAGCLGTFAGIALGQAIHQALERHRLRKADEKQEAERGRRREMDSFRAEVAEALAAALAAGRQGQGLRSAPADGASPNGEAGDAFCPCGRRKGPGFRRCRACAGR
jgi:hypothetical protein